MNFPPQGCHSAITSKEQALAYFATCKTITPDSFTDPKNITQFLLQISTINNIPKAVKNGIHAMAYLIEDMNNTNTADTITNVLKDQINDITRQLTTKTNTLHNLVQDVTSSATAIKNNILNKAMLPTQASPTSYAAAAQNFTSIEHADVIARGINIDKQLLILTDKTHKHNPYRTH